MVPEKDIDYEAAEKAAVALEKKIGELRAEIFRIFPEKGIDKSTGSEFYSLVGTMVQQYSLEAFNGNARKFQEFTDNLTAVVQNVAQMNEDTIKQFEVALNKWMEAIKTKYYVEQSINEKQFTEFVFIFFNKLFLQLGTTEFITNAQKADIASQLVTTLNK